MTCSGRTRKRERERERECSTYPGSIQSRESKQEVVPSAIPFRRKSLRGSTGTRLAIILDFPDNGRQLTRLPVS